MGFWWISLRCCRIFEDFNKWDIAVYNCKKTIQNVFLFQGNSATWAADHFWIGPTLAVSNWPIQFKLDSVLWKKKEEGNHSYQLKSYLEYLFIGLHPISAIVSLVSNLINPNSRKAFNNFHDSLTKPTWYIDFFFLKNLAYPSRAVCLHVKWFHPP